MRLLNCILVAAFALSCCFAHPFIDRRLKYNAEPSIPEKFKWPSKFYPVLCLDDNRGEYPVWTSIHVGAPFLQLMLAGTEVSIDAFPDYLKTLKLMATTYKEQLAGKEITLIIDRSWASVAQGVNLDALNKQAIKWLGPNEKTGDPGVLSYYKGGIYVKNQVRLLMYVQDTGTDYVSKVRTNQASHPMWAVAINPFVDAKKGYAGVDEKVAPIVTMSWSPAYAVDTVLQKLVMDTSKVPYGSMVRFSNQGETKTTFTELQKVNQALGMDKILITAHPINLREACDEDKTKTDTLIDDTKPEPPAPKTTTTKKPKTTRTTTTTPRPEVKTTTTTTTTPARTTPEASRTTRPHTTLPETTPPPATAPEPASTAAEVDPPGPTDPTTADPPKTVPGEKTVADDSDPNGKKQDDSDGPIFIPPDVKPKPVPQPTNNKGVWLAVICGILIAIAGMVLCLGLTAAGIVRIDKHRGTGETYLWCCGRQCCVY